MCVCVCEYRSFIVYVSTILVEKAVTNVAQATISSHGNQGPSPMETRVKVRNTGQQERNTLKHTEYHFNFCVLFVNLSLFVSQNVTVTIKQTTVTTIKPSLNSL